MSFSKLLIPLIALGVVAFTGCTSKSYYEPQKVSSTIKFDEVLKTSINDVARDGVTFSDGSVVTKVRGLLSYKIPKGYRFLYDSGRSIIVADEVGDLQIISRGKTLFKKRFDTAVVGAAKRANLLALIFGNNKIVLYDISRDKVLYKEELEPTFALDSRVANPLFVNDLVIFPTLDGRLLVLDRNRRVVLRDIAISDKELFNNVIYLQEFHNDIVAATAYKVISITPHSIYTKRGDIKDILYTGAYIYIFEKNGKITKADTKLQTIKEKKFDKALFVAVTMKGNIYVVEKGGYLIKLDPDLNLLGVYKLPSKIDEPVFAFKDRLFIGSGFIRLR